MKPDATTTQPSAGTAKPTYEPPCIIAHDEASLAQLVGPAVACARWDAGTSANSHVAEDGHEDESW